MDGSFDIGLSAWIIQDGNYGEFEAGREYRFALEFYPQALEPRLLASEAPRLSHVANTVYDALGSVIFSSDSAWAVDFGVLAYQDSKPPTWAKLGAGIRGRVYVGVDLLLLRASLVSAGDARFVSSLAHPSDSPGDNSVD